MFVSVFFFFKQKTAYEMLRSLVGSEMCIRDRLADASFENPQRFGGSDVMSRIHYDTEHPGKLLRLSLIHI